MNQSKASIRRGEARANNELCGLFLVMNYWHVIVRTSAKAGAGNTDYKEVIETNDSGKGFLLLQ